MPLKTRCIGLTSGTPPGRLIPYSVPLGRDKPVKVPVHFVERIPSTLFHQSRCQYPAHHGLRHHGAGRHHTGVRSLVVGFNFGPRTQIRRRQSMPHGSYRLERHLHHDRLAVADAAFVPPGAIGAVTPALVRPVTNDVVYLVTGTGGSGET